MRRHTGVIATATVAILLFAACGKASSTAGQPPTEASSAGTVSPEPTASSTESAIPPESPVPSESSPPGDIPDDTQFVPYHSKAGGFTVSVPEGWARSTTRTSVTFTDKLNTVVVSWEPASTAPTVASANANEIPVLRTTSRAFRLTDVESVTLPAGAAVLVTYQANSEPNKVTGKQYRLEVERFELFHAKNELIVTLLSPVGADNVDPWRIVTESLKWS